MSTLTVSLLGSFQATLDERPITGFESNKVRALLAYLAIESDRPHSRDELIGLLWPDQPDAAARANLRQALANLRQHQQLGFRRVEESPLQCTLSDSVPTPAVKTIKLDTALHLHPRR
jgi:DNA-binding SARP family transcriptional activator